MHNQFFIRQRILEVLDELISEHGTEGITVALIAQKADIPKGLIYRHFGGVEGLLSLYIRSTHAFPQFSLDFFDQMSLLHKGDTAVIWSDQMMRFFRQLRVSKASREILKASLTGDDGLATALSQVQHTTLILLLEQLELPRDIDTRGVLAILQGGLYYLTLMAHHDQSMMGIDLRSDTGWLLIEKALKTIINRLAINSLTAHDLPRLHGSADSQVA